VSAEAARQLYGVVITPDGRIDRAATRDLRAERRETHRRKDGEVKRRDGEQLARITDNLDLRREKDGLYLCCAKCTADLGPVRDNYKDHCVRLESDVSESNPNIGDYRRYIDDRPVFRQFFCPGCGALVENEVARAADPVLRDIELDMR
jgi:acetone carboxylase gamma subunit